ncbi:hypothetical protein CIHG_02097 [Coccidioides immitis H538.4]|nr:hypothetical protein CIHG_02097 [Coccidioides immitis H538.4]
MKQSDPHSVLHSDDGSSRLPARAEDTPSSTGRLTPASSENGSRDGDTVRNAIGRGQDLKKLQTNIREEREGDTPSSGSAGSATSGISERCEQRFRDERDEEDDLIAPYSRSYTAEEERRVVRKFDRR